jgi:glycosyltransferase involved in cell wall biosynthesis
MEIKNILICTLRYVNYNDEGLMKNYHIPFQLLSNLVDTLNSIKSFNVHTFFFDEHLEQYPGSNFKISLINLLREKKPDLIVFDQLLLGFVSPVHSLTNKLQKFEIPFYQSFFYYIKKNLKIPLVICWTDLQLGLSIDVAKQLEDYVTLHNVWDIKRDESFGKNYLFTPSPINSEVYNNLVSADRYIDISFVGSIGSKPDRQKILNSINKLKLNSEIRAGGLWSGKDTFLTDNQCADIYRRSKMVINFCLNEEGKAQIKGRVFETTLCGALLLEQENNETSQYFTPYIDYIPWKDENDLIEKIKYYLSHDEERKAITLSGSEKANKLYTGKVYWELLLKKINNVLV